MDTIFINGNILTMDRRTPKAEALAVQFGRIYKVGTTAEVSVLAGPETRVVDLKGRTMLPGFIDTHNHFCLFALLTDQADCRPAAGCEYGKDVVETLREKADRTPPGNWILGWGYAPYLLKDRKELTRDDLDRASKRHPLCLVHVSVHGAVVNSLALKELGYKRATPDPPGGKIMRDSQGNPNGILSESAFMGPLFFGSPSIYSKILAQYERERRVDMMIRCAERFLKLGIVGINDPFVDRLTLRSYQEAAETGRFFFRMRASILNQWADSLLSMGMKQGFGSQWLKLAGIKIFLDGGMSSRTAAVSIPYAGGEGGRGILNYDQRGITGQIHKFDGAGMQVGVHAQGDRALEKLIAAFEKTIEQGNPLRHYIIHAGNITTAQVERVRALGLYVCSQANFFSLLGDGFIEAYGPRRSQTLYPFRTLLKRGIRLSFSSDCPVADPDPLVGIRDAVYRRTASGSAIGLSESITAKDAVALYTREAAYFTFEEDIRGTLREGKWADMVVLDKDPTSIKPEDIPRCRVKMTIVGGKIIGVKS